MKRLIGALIIVVTAIVAGKFAFAKISQLSWFRLSQVEIACPDHLNEKQVLDESALKVGESIFDQDFLLAGNNIMDLPGVGAVDINRKLPSRVEIDVYPEKIILFARLDKLYGLTDGLKLVELKALGQVLPVVTGLTNRKKTRYQDKIKLCYALSLYKNLSSLSGNLSERLSEIHFVDSEKAEMFFDPGGVKVLLPLRNYDCALSRLVALDSLGILGNSGSFDMTAGKMVARHGV